MAASKYAPPVTANVNSNTPHDRAHAAPGQIDNSTYTHVLSLQPHYQQHRPFQGTDPETTSNTVANSHITAPAFESDTSLAVPIATRPAKFTEQWDASQRGSSIIDGHISSVAMQRSNSFSGSLGGDTSGSLSRGNTLKKKPSLRRAGSMRRSSSRRSMKAGSVRSLALQSTSDQPDIQSAFFCPVPVSGSPTEALASRFQAWRKVLKDLITYFRELQAHYEHRAKSFLKLSNVLNNTTTPPGFLLTGGIDDALKILRDYNRQAISEAGKAREIEEDVILALTGLRSDLHQKIKEIKNLSGDFKNSVQKEMDQTRKAVNHLQETLGQTELDSALTTGKQDPYLLRLAVDRQLYRQIDEENYLHQAYLNLENSGRELESIVVGEIQKSYNAYAKILKRESDAARIAVEELQSGPINMPKDVEWSDFVQRDDQFVDPDVPPRSAQFIDYPGRDHPLCQEIRAGLLERKSKYLKSYTAGWYVLSPTHLHEFKSADKTQAPLMSLFLPEQKLGSHSTEGGSSNKFILKGRQTGTMHRGHTWVFRAESHDTMMAWYEDIKTLTERSPEERSNFVRDHSRSYSRSSQRSFSSDGVVDDEDDPPFATAASVTQQPSQGIPPRRPSPGGRFPSDLQVNAERGLQVPLSPTSVSSGYDNHEHNAFPGNAGSPAGGVDLQQLVNPVDRVSSGSPEQVPIDATVLHSLAVEQAAKKDSVYLREPLMPGPLREPPVAHCSNRSILMDVHHSTSNGEPKESSLAPMTPDGFTSWRPDNAIRSEWANGNKAIGTSGLGTAQFGHQPYVASDAVQAHQNPLPKHATLAGETSPRRLPSEGETGSRQGASIASVSATNDAMRRPGVGMRNDSVPTISNLHIPGEFPQGTQLA